MAFEVNSVSSSLTIIPGLPRRSISALNSRATRRHEIEVSGIAARHSRVTSSTTFSTRTGRPALLRWQSVSICAPSAALADALSTAARLIDDRDQIAALCNLFTGAGLISALPS